MKAANAKTKRATTRGTRLHTLFEHFLNNEDVETGTNIRFTHPVSTLRSPFFLEIDNIFQQRRWSLALLALLTLCWLRRPAVVDLTSERTKPEEWLESYIVQLSAYWAMFSEATGVVPKKLVVFLVAENGDIQIVERQGQDILDYLRILRDYVSRFNESNSNV